MTGKEYTPKSPDYAKKSHLIETLSGVGKKDPKTFSTLLALGQAAAEDIRISNKQSGQLIDALNRSRILTYADTFVRSGKDPKDVDGVKWHVEFDGKLQFHILSVLYQLSSKSLPVDKQVELLTDLLNKAHMAGFAKTDYLDSSRDDEDGSWRKGFRFLEQKEGNLVKEAKKMGYQIEIGTLRYEEEYDQLMVEQYRNDIGKNPNVLKKLAQLEEVAYLGFAMGVRDGVESWKRRWE